MKTIVLLAALLLSGCPTWCRVASGSVVIAEGLVQTWTAIARDACVPERTQRCGEAQEHLRRALAALIAAQLAVAPCGPEDPAGFTLARVEPDVDLDALEKELDRLEKAAENWEKGKKDDQPVQRQPGIPGSSAVRVPQALPAGPGV